MPALSLETLEVLRKNHPAWRLLASDNVALVAAFLHRTFLDQRVHGVSQSDLVSKLNDMLFALQTETDAYTRSAEGYVEVWSHDSTGWLRKYYPEGLDEPHYDLTPSTEKALTWLEGLTQTTFVGTESRLLTVFDLLRQLIVGTSDPEVRLRDLERRRDEINREIAAVKAGTAEVMAEVEVRDRFQQAAATARELLSDFRQVEQNFRTLDRQTRERIALWGGTKGELLETVLGERDAIAESDQGRSFRAFWDFLMDPARQEELGRLWEAAYGLPAVRALQPDPRLRRIHFDWLGAGDHAQRTVALLSAQLRRFLDDRVWLENRRIAQILHSLEAHALALRDELPSGPFFEMDALAPEFDLPMERPLYSPPFRAELKSDLLQGSGTDVDASLLFGQVLVDSAVLEGSLATALEQHGQVSLGQLVDEHPLEEGLAEVVAWLGVASGRESTVFDETAEERLGWTRDARSREAVGPRVLMTNQGGTHGTK